jgi:hypothetical protein
MTGIEDIVVGALCVWRVTHLLNAEDGPYAVLVRLRRAAGSGLGGQALACFDCLSLLLAAPVAFAIGAGWPARLLLWPALSGAACLLQRAVTPALFPGLVLEDKE